MKREFTRLLAKIILTLKMVVVISVAVVLGYFSITTEACSNGEKDGTGVELLGTYYDCKYLRDFYPEDRFIGIYERRKYHCGMLLTDCCETCQKILSCEDAPVDGIYLAESYYNCSFLQKPYPEDRFIGIYENRNSICQSTTTNCCESCDKVRQEKNNSTTTVERPSTTTARTSREPLTGKTPPVPTKDTCTNNCLWIADGYLGQCSWLLNKTSSVYKIRKSLCNGLTDGCERTCHIISKETEVTKQTTSTVTTAASVVCKDTFMMVEKYSYACSDLLNPNSNIYNKRQALCSSDRIACCVTCDQVNSVKPSGVIKYTDQNTIDKNTVVIENVPSVIVADDFQNDDSRPANDIKLRDNAETKQTTTQSSGIENQFFSFLDIIKASTNKIQQEEERRKKMFQNLMANIFATFQRVQSARNLA